MLPYGIKSKDFVGVKWILRFQDVAKTFGGLRCKAIGMESSNKDSYKGRTETTRFPMCYGSLGMSLVLKSSLLIPTTLQWNDWKDPATSSCLPRLLECAFW